MIDVIEINEHNLWFRSDIGDLFVDIKPKWAATHRTFHEIYWVPVSKYILQKMLSYEYNEQLALALEKIESKEIQIQINAKNNKNDLLRDYQKLGVARIQADNHLLIWEMQTGKIATVCNALANTNKAIVFINKKDTNQWIQEFKKFGKREDVYVINSKMNENQRCDFVDDLVKRQDKFIILMDSHLLTQTSCLYGIKRFDHMVIDEGHWLTKPKTKLSWRMNNLRNRVDKVCIILDRPFKKSPAEIIELLKLMYGERQFARSNYNPFFLEEIKVLNWDYRLQGKPKIPREKLLDKREEEWMSFMDLYSYHVLAREDLKPRVQRINKSLTIHPAQRHLYKKLIQSYSQGEAVFKQDPQLIARAQQLLLCPELLQLELPPEHEMKWIWLLWYLRKHREEKIILYTPFGKHLDILYNRLNNKGYKCAKITGQTTTSERIKTINEFKNEKLRVLLVDNTSFNKAWTLNEVDTVIFLSRDINQANNDQLGVRFCSPYVGMKQNKKIINVIIGDIIDEYVNDKLE